MSLSGRCASRGPFLARLGSGTTAPGGIRGGRDDHTGEGETALDEAALEAFADRMIGVLNDASTALMISIGHQTGLFGALHGTGPATSAQVADAGGIRRRY